MELGDILAGDEAEGRGIQVDFQVGTLNPTGPPTYYTVATRCCLSSTCCQIKTRSQGHSLSTQMQHSDHQLDNSNVCTDTLL